ncbi:MAG: tetratricopeptide repeat protein [Bacteroidales bacterium]|nr:tetratricopeptide repeat protein [Bacteroidales bacterium]
MSTDRFDNYDSGVRQLVLAFEKAGGQPFFDVDDLLVIADYYLETHNVEGLEAAVLLGERIYPHNGDIRLRRAQLCGVQGDYSQALSLLKRLELDDPGNTDVCYSLATLYSLTGHSKESIDYYLRASADGYELGMVFANVADEYRKLGNTAQAVRYYRKAVAHNPNEQRSLYALSNIWDCQCRQDQAVRFFTHHVTEHPYCKEGWHCLGFAYLWGRENDAAKAVDALEYAIAIDKHFENAYYTLAEAYLKMGNRTEAISTLRAVLDYSFDRVWVMLSIGDIYMESGNYHTAYVYFREAANTDPRRYSVWTSLGRCCEQLGYADEAEEHYLRAIDLGPEDEDIWLLLADMYMRQERFADAATLLQDGRNQFVDIFAIYSRLLYCYFRLGKRNRLFSLLLDMLPHLASELQALLLDYPDMALDAEIVSLINHTSHRDNEI